MAINVTYNGVSYTIPTRGELNWDSLNPYLQALAASMPAGGSNAPLTSELDFGAAFGVKSLYYKSRTANPAAAGVVRLANGDSVSWRNVANSADLALTTNASNRLALAGVEQVDLSSAQTLTNKTLTAPVLSGSVSGTAVLPTTVTHTQSAWVTMTGLTNSWVTPSASASNQGSAQYRFDSNGVVWFRGSIGAGTLGATFFTMPSGLRPPVLQQFAVVSLGAFGLITIDTTGAVSASGNNTYVSLSGVSYSVI